MRTKVTGIAATAALCAALLAGCGPKAEEPAADVAAGATPPEPTVPAAPVALPTDAWIGRWVGVEGLVLEIAKGVGAGSYKLHIALMDGAGDYAGTADGETIRFTRGGVAETIRHTNGAGTGLKWLAEKKDCLTIKPAEGFCRD